MKTKIASTQKTIEIEDIKLTRKQRHTNVPFAVWPSSQIPATTIEDLNIEQLRVALYRALKMVVKYDAALCDLHTKIQDTLGI